ncbi:hypothetical protein BH23CHL7_BH23CHL7_22280 [soil metagenome]
MTTERDLDRLLSGWLAEGSDRVPEWAVWSALDAVAQTPQRRRWRRQLDETVGRLTSITRLSVVAAGLLALAVVYVAYRGGLDIGLAPRILTEQDLAAIVVWEDTMPSDWILDGLETNYFSVMTTPVRTMEAEEFAERAELTGYTAGRITYFTGPDSVFISWATLFETAEQSDSALDLYLFEQASPEGWGVGPATNVELGDEGYLLTGETRVLMGDAPGDPVPMQIYLWRRSNVVLAAAGWFDYDPTQLAEVARGMDHRVP